MKKLTEYLRSNLKETILAPLFKMLEAFFELWIPIIVARMIDSGISSSDTGFIWKMGGLMVLLGLVGFASAITAQFFAARAASACGTAMRSDLFGHISKLPFSEIDRLGTSALITRMTSDINQVQTGVNMFLRLFLRSPFIVFGAVIMAFSVDRRAAVPFAVVVPLLAAVVFLIIFSSLPLYRKVQQQLDRVLLKARETITGVRVVRAFCREDAEVRDFADENGELYRRQIFVGRLSALLNPLTFVLINLGIVLLLRRGSVMINAGALSQGKLIALINYMSQILVELIKLANLIITLSRAAAGARRIEDIFSIPEEEDTGTQPFPAEAVRSGPASLSVRNLTFTYAGGKAPVLEDICFDAPAGSHIGIIGGTGSGKSSLSNLLSGFYPPDSGEILIGGIPLQTIRPAELKKHLHLVPQKAALVSGTLRDNLKWGDETAGDDVLWKALSVSQAEEFVRQSPDGLDMRIEQNGRNLSGGQRQRLTIARAVAGDPDILILDDSSSALDYATDAALRRALSEDLPEKTTVLLISQRISTVRSADRILVLHRGKQCGFGTHAELMASCEVYREICRSQMSPDEYEKEAGNERA